MNEGLVLGCFFVLLVKSQTPKAYIMKPETGLWKFVINPLKNFRERSKIESDVVSRYQDLQLFFSRKIFELQIKFTCSLDESSILHNVIAHRSQMQDNYMYMLEIVSCFLFGFCLSNFSSS